MPARFTRPLILALGIAACGEPDLAAPGALEYVTAPVPGPRAGGPQVRVAAVAMAVAPRVATNLARMAETVTALTAADPAIRLVHFGEAVTGRYAEDETYHARIAEPIPGPATAQMGALARRHRVYIAWGLIEAAGARRYNSLVVTGPDGRIAAVHRKMLLFDADEDAGISEAGFNAQVFDVDGLRVGLMICYDGKSAHLQTALREGGADLVLLSVASNLEQGEVSPTARRLGAWLSVANRVGREGDLRYTGNVYGSDPAGNVLAELHGREGAVVFDAGRAP